MNLTSGKVAALTKRRWGILVAGRLVNLCIGSMCAWSSLSAPMAREQARRHCLRLA